MLINPWINDDNSCNILVISLFNMYLFNIMTPSRISRFRFLIFTLVLSTSNYIMAMRKIKKKKNFDIHFLQCVLYTNVRRKCWHSQIESLSNIIKYALTDRFEQKCFKRGCTPNLLSSHFIILRHCVNTQMHIYTFYVTDTPIPLAIYVHIF